MIQKILIVGTILYLIFAIIFPEKIYEWFKRSHKYAYEKIEKAGNKKGTIIFIRVISIFQLILMLVAVVKYFFNKP